MLQMFVKLNGAAMDEAERSYDCEYTQAQISGLVHHMRRPRERPLIVMFEFVSRVYLRLLERTPLVRTLLLCLLSHNLPRQVHQPLP